MSDSKEIDDDFNGARLMHTNRAAIYLFQIQQAGAFNCRMFCLNGDN